MQKDHKFYFIEMAYNLLIKCFNLLEMSIPRKVFVNQVEICEKLQKNTKGKGEI